MAVARKCRLATREQHRPLPCSPKAQSWRFALLTTQETAPRLAQSNNARKPQDIAFEVARSPERQFWKNVIALVLLSAAICSAIVLRDNRHATSAVSATASNKASAVAVTGGHWIQNWSFSPDRPGRNLNIYDLTRRLSDYRLEFSAQIEHRAVGWIVRAKDASNYYAFKLRIAETDSGKKVVLERYLLRNDEISNRAEIPLKLPPDPETVFLVSTEAFHDTIRTRVQGELVDEWRDTSLNLGAAGFLNENGEGGRPMHCAIFYLGSSASR